MKFWPGTHPGYAEILDMQTLPGLREQFTAAASPGSSGCR